MNRFDHCDRPVFTTWGYCQADAATHSNRSVFSVFVTILCSFLHLFILIVFLISVGFCSIVIYFVKFIFVFKIIGVTGNSMSCAQLAPSGMTDPRVDACYSRSRKSTISSARRRELYFCCVT